MNELKIIIKAVTKDAIKPIQDVKKELEGLNGASASASSGIAKSMKAIGIATAAIVASVTAATAALVSLGKATVEYSKGQGKLVTAFQAVGASVSTANEAYRGFYRFLGDTGKSIEASGHLAKLATGHKSLAEWVKISQGVYATFGESLPIEGFVEAANETLRVGKVTGTLADALNWAGVSEDEFNKKLAQTVSYEEREALLRNTLNGLYQEASQLYEKNNRDVMAYNESQAKLSQSMAEAGKACVPFITAINNLGSAIFTALKPALDAIVPYLTAFINWITKGIQAVLSFFTALTGKSSAVKTVAEIADKTKSLATTTANATAGADKLASGLEGVGAAAKEAQRHLQGFDELNVLSSGKTDVSALAPSYTTPAGGYFDNDAFSAEFEEGEETVENFVDKIKARFEGLKDLFAPTISSWSDAFTQIKKAWHDAQADFENGYLNLTQSLGKIINYIAAEFIPNVVNSFSENFAPLFGDVISLIISETGKTFSWFGELFTKVTNDIILPAFKFIEKIITDIFAIIGQIWASKGEPFVQQVKKACENIRQFFTDIYDKGIKPVWDKILPVLEKVWDKGIKPLLKRVGEFVLEVTTLLLKLYNQTIAPIVSWLMDKILPIVVDVIGTVVECVGDMFITMSEIARGIIDAFEGVIKFLVGVFTLDFELAWEGILQFFDGIWDGICGVVKLAWQTIQTILKPVVTFFTSLWQQLEKIYAPVPEFFRGIFSSAWTKIQSVFSGWTSFFSGLWGKIKNTFSGLGTTLGDAIGGAVKTALNRVIGWVESTINKAIGLINGAIDVINKLPGVDVGKISKLSLPRLAEGGIVNSTTIAMIGEAGKEAVLPLENNTEWMDILAERIASRGSSPSRIILKVGEKELGWASINGINQITKQTGELQLVL